MGYQCIRVTTRRLACHCQAPSYVTLLTPPLANPTRASRKMRLSNFPFLSLFLFHLPYFYGPTFLSLLLFHIPCFYSLPCLSFALTLLLWSFIFVPFFYLPCFYRSSFFPLSLPIFLFLLMLNKLLINCPLPNLFFSKLYFDNKK